MTTEETNPECLVSVQGSFAETWVSGGLLQVGALTVAVHAWKLLKEVTMIFITPP